MNIRSVLLASVMSLVVIAPALADQYHRDVRQDARIDRRADRIDDRLDRRSDRSGYYTTQAVPVRQQWGPKPYAYTYYPYYYYYYYPQ